MDAASTCSGEWEPGSCSPAGGSRLSCTALDVRWVGGDAGALMQQRERDIRICAGPAARQRR